MRCLKSAMIAALALFAGCGLFGGVEGHYTIDRELTSAAIDSYARQELAQMVGQVKGKNAKVSEDELKSMKTSVQSMVDQMAIDLNLDAGGKFHGSATIEGKTETSEGTWIRSGETVRLTETLENGKPRPKVKTEMFHYSDGQLSLSDAKENTPFIILARH